MKKTQKKEFSKALGLKYIELYECQFKRQLAENTEMRAFVDTSYPQFYRKYRSSKKVTMDTILDNVCSDTLFGAVLCDIKVPEHLYEEFSEFSPLFCTTNIPYEVIGDVMQTFWKETQTHPNGEMRPYPDKNACWRHAVCKDSTGNSTLAVLSRERPGRDACL